MKKMNKISYEATSNMFYLFVKTAKGQMGDFYVNNALSTFLTELSLAIMNEEEEVKEVKEIFVGEFTDSDYTTTLLNTMYLLLCQTADKILKTSEETLHTFFREVIETAKEIVKEEE